MLCDIPAGVLKGMPGKISNGIFRVIRLSGGTLDESLEESLKKFIEELLHMYESFVDSLEQFLNKSLMRFLTKPQVEGLQDFF